MCPKHLSLSLCPWFGQISSVNPIPYTWYDLVRWHTMLPGTLHTLPLIPWYLPSGVVPGCLSDGLLLAPPKLSLSSLEPEKYWMGFLDDLQTFMPVLCHHGMYTAQWSRLKLLDACGPTSPHYTGAKWQNLLKRNGWKNMTHMKRKIHQHLQTCHLKPGALWDHQMILLPRLTPLGRSPRQNLDQAAALTQRNEAMSLGRSDLYIPQL